MVVVLFGNRKRLIAARDGTAGEYDARRAQVDQSLDALIATRLDELLSAVDVHLGDQALADGPG